MSHKIYIGNLDKICIRQRRAAAGPIPTSSAASGGAGEAGVPTAPVGPWVGRLTPPWPAGARLHAKAGAAVGGWRLAAAARRCAVAEESRLRGTCGQGVPAAGRARLGSRPYAATRTSGGDGQERQATWPRSLAFFWCVNCICATRIPSRPFLLCECEAEHPNPNFIFGSDISQVYVRIIMPTDFDFCFCKKKKVTG